jgi:hypothetical protein
VWEVNHKSFQEKYMKKVLATVLLVLALAVSVAPVYSFGPLPPPPVEGICSDIWGPPCN